jgi:hypothetical protein
MDWLKASSGQGLEILENQGQRVLWESMLPQMVLQNPAPQAIAPN